MTDSTAAGPPSAVIDAVRGVPGWAGRAFDASPVLGGLQNDNWLIRFPGEKRRYFLKLPGAGTDAFIDRRNAHAAGLRAAAAGISPEVVAFSPETGIEVTEFLEGHRAATNGDMKSPEVASSVIQLFRTFHNLEPLPVTKTIFEMLDEHLDQATELGVPLPSTTAAVLRETAAARQAMEASGLDLVPCHNDPMPGNFLLGEHGPTKLIDFEFASNNERAYELAVMLTEFFYDERRCLELIEQFSGNTRWETVARVRVCGALADVKWGLWGCVNHRLTERWDFDYHKYGTWKLARARAVMADPRWPLWLSSL
jgi:thiamine kinase-like enzyme